MQTFKISTKQKMVQLPGILILICFFPGFTLLCLNILLDDLSNRSVLGQTLLFATFSLLGFYVVFKALQHQRERIAIDENGIYIQHGRNLSGTWDSLESVTPDISFTFSDNTCIQFAPGAPYFNDLIHAAYIHSNQDKRILKVLNTLGSYPQLKSPTDFTTETYNISKPQRIRKVIYAHLLLLIVLVPALAVLIIPAFLYQVPELGWCILLFGIVLLGYFLRDEYKHNYYNNTYILSPEGIECTGRTTQFGHWKDLEKITRKGILHFTDGTCIILSEEYPFFLDAITRSYHYSGKHKLFHRVLKYYPCTPKAGD